MKKVVWSPNAEERLTECLESIAKDSQKNAKKALEEIEKGAATLADFPEIGKTFQLDKNFRTMTVGRKYRIFYLNGTEKIRIVHFQHAKQLTPSKISE
jgi:plasmid stabilization system protein ParE